MEHYSCMTSKEKVKKLLEFKKGEIIQVDIGCGRNKAEDFIGMDMRDVPGVDIVHNLEETPWPFPTESVTLLSASHVLEHINPLNQGFIKVMDEAWRVLKYGGQFRIAVPYGGSAGYFADPTHVNPIVSHTWHYFDPMQATKLYGEYEPCPWAILNLYWAPDGNMEVLLSKRRDDIAYHYDKKIHHGKK